MVKCTLNRTNRPNEPFSHAHAASEKLKCLGLHITSAFLLMLSISAHGSLEEGNPENTRNMFIEKRVTDLVKVWESAYQMEKTLPDVAVASELVAPAPHLQDCVRISERIKSIEKWDQKGRPPNWLHRQGGPKPPWIRGSDDDNLAWTRLVQSEIWQQQFPANCSDPNQKFALFRWQKMNKYGIGAALHSFSGHFGYSMSKGRTFVPIRGSFERASHSDCEGRLYGSMECYFVSLTSPECESQALALWDKSRKLDESKRVVYLDGPSTAFKKFYEPKNVSEPWLQSPFTVEVMGAVLKEVEKANHRKYHQWTEIDKNHLKATWWYAQSLRFLLRWPSLLLCHKLNMVRHEAYGQQAAINIIKAKQGMVKAQRKSQEYDKHEATLLKSRRKRLGITPESLEHKIWWKEEPYIPRPIVSVYVRQGDKGHEMKLYSMAAHMWLAERLRLRVPHMDTVWLSTEMESVIQESKNYSSWLFLYSRNKRQNGRESMFNYTKATGPHELTVISFVNLIISTQCDYFIGHLGSNWARLINELRLTNGRLNNGFVAINYGEW